jgi:hypothetical protein
LLGFLDALPTHGELTGEASTLARTVMRTTARAIEERSFRKRYRREWIVALAPPDGGDYGMLLAVDGQARIRQSRMRPQTSGWSAIHSAACTSPKNWRYLLARVTK